MPSKGKATRVGVVVGVVRAGRVDPALFIAGDSLANRNLLRGPTSGLEPLTCSLRVRGRSFLGVAEVCSSLYIRGFLFFGLPVVALCCIRVRVKLGSGDAN
jgi:hypothetical protein